MDNNLDVVEHIAGDEYQQIVEKMPVFCIDLIVNRDDEVLLGKRNNEPAKEYWFVPGGRQYKGEPMEETVHRIGQEELGIEVDIQGQLGTYDHFYTESRFEDTSTHTPVTAYLVEPLDEDLETDNQHEALEFFSELPENTHPYTETYIEDAQGAGWL